jgi:hypothetical protein
METTATATDTAPATTVPKKIATTLEEGLALVRWAPRVAPHSIRRLYERDALGIVDDEQIDEVGYALYARCLSIVRASAAHSGEVTCPRCERVTRHRYDEAVIRCGACGWRVRHEDYLATYQHRQLVGGGALPVFTAFVQDFEKCRTPQEKMIAIDQLLHEFHGRVVAPGRPAAKNLLDFRRTSEVLSFLDDLTYGAGSTPGLQETREVWRVRLRRKVSRQHQDLVLAAD